MHWRYRINKDYNYDPGVDVALDAEREYCDNGKLWMVIAPGGTITVKKGYAWDGCSPTINVLDLGYLGTLFAQFALIWCVSCGLRLFRQNEESYRGGILEQLLARLRVPYTRGQHEDAHVLTAIRVSSPITDRL